MSFFPQTDITSGWGAGGTQGGAHASFFKRYYKPLVRYARWKFGFDLDQAEELTQRFLTRQLQRDRADLTAVFRLYDPQKGRFRSLLVTSFWRFCRDELRRAAPRTALSLDALPEDAGPGSDFEFCRMVARELFDHLRAAIAEALTDATARAFLDLKWPPGGDEPLSNAAIARRLDLSRQQTRTLQGKIADRFTYLLNRQLFQAGLDREDAAAILGDCCRVLDQDQRRSAP